jgi:hypothetical protein
MLIFDYGLIDFLAKRCERQAHQLEMLLCKWKSDNSNGKNYSKNQVSKGDPDSAEHNPDDIEYRRQAPGVARNLAYILSKWKQGEKTNFETLDTKRDTDDRETK